MNIDDVKKLCKKYGIFPSKKLGQNFLVDENTLKQIMKAAHLSKNDIILEIGPGLGSLTFALAKKVERVVTIEKDKKMCEVLKKELEGSGVRNVKVVNNDILKLNPKPYALKTYRIMANLPYYITSPVIRKFLELKKQPSEMILMVQKEVAQRICAHSPKMSILSVSVQFYAQPEIVSFVSKKSFWPQPKVDSAIIRIVPHGKKFSDKFNRLFFKIIKAGFSHPRKQLVNNLSQELKVEKEKVRNWLLENKIQPTQRAETLSIYNWQKLTKTFKMH